MHSLFSICALTIAVFPLASCDALSPDSGKDKHVQGKAEPTPGANQPSDQPQVNGEQPGEQSGEPAKPGNVSDNPTAPKSRSHLAQTTEGKAIKLEQLPAEVRKAFWVAIGDGRKQTAGKHYDEAIAAFDLALTKIPNHPRALSGRGYAKLLAGKLDAAEADLHRALAAPGTKKLEAAIAFNLGLVAEKRGETERAHGYFALSNTLRPSKPAEVKLAGDKKACPVEIVPDAIESQLYATWREVWDMLAKDGLVASETPPKTEQEAKKIICTSEALTAGETDTFDACASSDPWLSKFYYDYGGHALFAFEPADADQIRVSFIGEAGAGRCGANSEASIKGSSGEAVIHWEVTEYVPIDVMYNDKDEIVDCTTEDCFTACGDEADATAIDVIIHPFNADPTIIRSPTDKDGRATVKVTLENNEIVLKGNCNQRIPVRSP